LDPLANPAVRQQHKDEKQAHGDFSSASALLRDGIPKSKTRSPHRLPRFAFPVTQFTVLSTAGVLMTQFTVRRAARARRSNTV
jgi:hypothetical protein